MSKKEKWSHWVCTTIYMYIDSGVYEVLIKTVNTTEESISSAIKVNWEYNLKLNTCKSKGLELTARHWRRTHVCFSLPGPPNFFISLQKLHSPHSGLRHASQRLQRTRRRRSADIAEAGFVGRGRIGVVANLGRPTGAGGGGGWYQEGCLDQNRWNWNSI